MKMKEAVRRLLEKATGARLITEKELDRRLDDRETLVRRMMEGDMKAASDLRVRDMSDLSVLFEERNIPAGLLEVAIDLGVTAGNLPAVQMFESCCWKGGSDKTVATMREARNWITLGSSYGQSSFRMMSDDLRRVVQDFSVYWSEKSPGLKGAVKMLRRYVIGRGVETSTGVKEIDDVWKKFLKDIQYEKRQKSLFSYMALCGEMNVVIRKTAQNEWWASLVSYAEMDFADAVIKDPDNRDKIVAVGRRVLTAKGEASTYYDATAQMYGLPIVGRNLQGDPILVETDSYSLFRVSNGVADEDRSRPTYHAALRPAKLWDDFVTNRARLTDFRSRVIMVETLTTNAGVSASSEVRKMPTSGIILKESNQKKLRFDSPNVDAADASNDGKLLMYNFCAAMETPPHVAFQDAENSNYASIREADTPFTQVVLDWQDEWSEFLDDLFGLMVRIWVDDGTLNKEYSLEVKQPDGSVKTESVQTTDVKLSKVFPEVVKTNLQMKTDETKMLREGGIISKRTTAIRHGIDWDAEQEFLAQDRREAEEEMKKRAAAWQQTGGMPDEDAGEEDEEDKEEPDDEDKKDEKEPDEDE